MTTIDPVKLKTFLAAAGIKLETLADKAAIKLAITNATTATATPALAPDLTALGSIDDVVSAAIQTHVTTTIKGNINKTFPFKPNDPNTEVDLNGLTPKQVKIGSTTYPITPGTPVEIKDGSNTVAKIDFVAGKLKITEIKDASKISNIELVQYEYKGETISPTGTDKIEIGVKEGTLANQEVTLKDKKATFKLNETGVTIAAQENDTFKVTVSGDDVTIELKKDIDKETDLVLNVTAGGKATTKTVKVKPEAAGTEGKFEWGDLFNWNKTWGKLVYGAIIAIVAFFGGRSYSNS